MAAHIKTALEQIAENKYPSGHVRIALQFSCWSEELSLDDYCRFDDIVNHFEMTDTEKDKECRRTAKLLLPKYTSQWETLGKPQTREAWRMAQFGK